MKKAKILFAASALILLLASCEKDFTVQTGTTPVEFTAGTMEVVLNSNYNYIPVRMTAQGALSTYTTFELVDGTIVLKDSTSVPVEEGVNVIFTSKELYVGAYDSDADGEEGLPSNNIEFSIPSYLDYQSVSLTLRLTGEYLGSNTELTWTATAPIEVTITGNWNFEGTVLNVYMDENENYYVNYFSGSDTQYPAARTGNTLTIDNTAALQVDAGGSYGVVNVVMCAYHNDDDGTGPYLWPDEAVVLEFAEDGKTVDLTNGLFIGFNTSGNSWASYTSVLPTTGNKL